MGKRVLLLLYSEALRRKIPPKLDTTVVVKSCVNRRIIPVKTYITTARIPAAVKFPLLIKEHARKGVVEAIIKLVCIAPLAGTVRNAQANLTGICPLMGTAYIFLRAAYAQISHGIHWHVAAVMRLRRKIVWPCLVCFSALGIVNFDR